MERGIDSMKYRKSTHLAGVDVEAIIEEKGSCILTIKDAFYDKGVDVSGNKTDGYFLEFDEPIKGMVVNSGNRKTIANIVKTLKNCTSAESRKIDKWIGVQIELYFDENVKMMGQIVGGIRVKAISPTPSISDANALGILKGATTLEELKTLWETITPQEKKLPTVVAKKESLKTTLK